MSDEITPTRSAAWDRFVKKAKRVLRWTLIIIIVFIGTFLYWKYFYTYSEGSRPGLLQKFSYKGNIFKTYEGELILSSVSSSSNIALASEKFYFSVPDKNLAPKFFEFQGRDVVVYYQEKKGVVFWRGDSRYLVDSIRLMN